MEPLDQTHGMTRNEEEAPMDMRPQDHYALGYSDRELQRLIRQSAMYSEMTEAMLRSAGIGEGMRVLDAGCGAGCVSLLAARLVGPAGSVLGLDRSAQALAVARRRADAEGLHQVRFIQAELSQLEHEEVFDALIGRFVLMFLPHPSEVLRTLARRVRAGGVIAFQEMDISAARSVPDMPTWRQCGTWIRETFQHARVDTQMGPRLHATFLHAGLPQPHMRLQASIGGAPVFPAHEYFADIVASLLPKMTDAGIASAQAVEIDTLAERLRTEMISQEGVVILPSLVSAWVRTQI